MKYKLVQTVLRTKMLTELVCTYHRRGILCPLLPQNCPPAEVSTFDNRTDIYRIGALLLAEVHNSCMPYQPHLYKQINRILTCSGAELSLAERDCLGEILQRCLHPRPQGRYTCCEELLRALDKLIGVSTACRRIPP